MKLWCFASLHGIVACWHLRVGDAGRRADEGWRGKEVQGRNMRQEGGRGEP